MLSPANLGGERARLIFNPDAAFPLARQLRSGRGAALGDVFSFVSGLYFRGKMSYAQAFGKVPEGLSGALVISPAEGLRFLHEPVTADRLRAWATVDIDERNPRFTEPLIAHAQALWDALGDSTRFVLLGSVATDKYVQPLTRVFGERLLFPPQFAGRGDMSRGALLLRAARASSELDYVPIVSSERHKPRPTAPPQAGPDAHATMPEALELVILVGLPGAGKSSFFRQRFGSSHVHISKDNFRNHRRPERRQRELIEEALNAGLSVVIDNTNASIEERSAGIAAAHRHGARVVGYFFDCALSECMARNRLRQGRERVPDVGILTIAKRLVEPTAREGFDALHLVQVLPAGAFDVSPHEPDA
jgi:predicted kinase